MRVALRSIAVVIVTALVVPITTAGTVFAAFLFLPLPASMPKPLVGVTAQVSHIYDSHNNEIGQFRQFETTKPVKITDIPEILEQAVISSEDRRYREHGGVDPIGTLRALWNDLRGGAVQGGSTITQQYVKNAYVGSERSLSRKIREAILASQLDRQLDKDQILFLYLSNIFLGEGAHGVGAAAETYFRKSVKDLTISEAATLAGLIPAPSRYEPRGNIELAEEKRRIVLKKMFEQGYIKDTEYVAAVQAELWLGPFPPPEGQPATMVFPRAQEPTAYPYFIDYVRRYIEANYGAGAESMGLEIYTTLDKDLQEAAEDEVAKAIEGVPPHPEGGPLQMALASVEPGSGYVKALVGGTDFYAAGGQNNLAITSPGRPGRQPGSSYKPFVLAEALEQGVKPTKTYSGRSPLSIGTPPHDFENYGGSSYGTVTLREATKRSVNTVFVQLLRDVGIEKTMNLARDLGVQGSVYRDDLGLAVALGTIGTSPLDMASAFGVWANRGERPAPTPIVEIQDSEGVVLESNREPKGERIVKEITADTMNDVLQGVFSQGGTANGKGLNDRPAAGKTGTTQDNRDAWFVGYTPNLSTAVWMGYRDREVEMRNIKGVRSVTGGTIPAATWQRFMKRAHEGLDIVQFNQPAPITEVADEAKREARGGFDVGDRFSPRGTDDGATQAEPLPPPTVEAPPETTTTTTPDDGILGTNAGGGRSPDP